MKFNWETTVAICHLGNVIWQAHFLNLIETLQTYINFQDKGYSVTKPTKSLFSTFAP